MSTLVLQPECCLIDLSKRARVSSMRERSVLVGGKYNRAVIVESEMSIDLETGGEFLIPVIKGSNLQRIKIREYCNT